MKYDVVIIGAGVGGLTAAAILAKAGLKVCILEKEPHPGGYLAGFRRKDFRFDTAIHWLNQYGPGGMVTRVFDIIGEDYPKAKEQDLIRRYKGDNFDYLLTNDPDQLKKQWQEEFPEDKEGIEKFFKSAKRLGRSFSDFGHIFRSEETMGFWERLGNKRNLLKFGLPFIPYLRYSGEKGMAKGLHKYFKSKKLQQVFCADTELLGALVPIGWAYYNDFQMPPDGGGQMIPEWMQHVIECFGGVIKCRTSAQKILYEGNKATAVVAEHRNGQTETIECDYVIAACDAALLYEQLLDEKIVPEKLRAQLHEAEMYSSSVTVSIAIDCSPGDLGFGTELLHLSSEQHSRAAHSSGQVHSSEMIVLPPSLRDPSLAPEGQGTLVIFMPAYMDFEDQWRTEKDEHGNMVRGEAYKQLKTEIAEKLIDRVSKKLNIDLKSHILFYDVATPVTHWRYTGNLGGTMMGTKPGRANMQNKVARYHTPLKNVFLGGHWAELGGGVPIAVKAGANSSLLVLQQTNKKLFRLIADYMDDKKTISEIRNCSLLKQCDQPWEPKPTPAQRKAKLRDQQQGD